MQRIFIYPLVWLLTTVLIVVGSIFAAAYHTDLSAMAVFGFLPFLMPLFALQAAPFSIGAIIIGEVALWIRKIFQSG